MDTLKESICTGLDETIKQIQEAQQQIMDGRYEVADNTLSFATSGCASARQFLKMSLVGVIKEE